MNEDAFAPRLRELREAAGLTQRDLAEATGSTIRNISRLETGAQEATWPTVLKLCKALGVSCDAFTVEPAEQPPAKPGRPRKAAEADPVETGNPLASADPSDTAAADRRGLKGAQRESLIQGRRELRAKKKRQAAAGQVEQPGKPKKTRKSKEG